MKLHLFPSTTVCCFVNPSASNDNPVGKATIVWGYTDEGAEGLFCKSDVIDVALQGLCLLNLHMCMYTVDLVLLEREWPCPALKLDMFLVHQ